MSDYLDKTEQETFWRGDFGDSYIDRNSSEPLLRSNIALFTKILKSAEPIQSVVELGCNIGLNLRALQNIFPDIHVKGFDINKKSVDIARLKTNGVITHSTIIRELILDKPADLSFTKTVLIHINPQYLETVYENLFRLSQRYVLVAEYYNPSPVTVTYRGHSERLFKRDFAGEIIDKFGMKIVDYGFAYHRDVNSQDDITWFLLEK